MDIDQKCDNYVSSADEKFKNVTVEPSFNIYKKTMIYPLARATEFYLFLNLIMQV
jgi:hypothetical protein